MSAKVKIAVVTGGASGMGAEIAFQLARDGVAVAVWDVNHDGARTIALAINDAGGRAVAQKVDVTSRAEVASAASQVADLFGPANILVNAAGLGFHLPIEAHSEQIIDRIIDLNLKGTFNPIHALVSGMTAGGWGRIVTIASSAGQGGFANMTGYSAAKAGVIGLTKAVAKEVGGRGVTCNIVSPGPIDTPMLRNSLARSAFTMEESQSRTLMGRFGRVDEIAAAALYFISDSAGFVTGQLIGVNGGELM